MSTATIVLVSCSLFGYGALLGWWARGKALTDREKFADKVVQWFTRQLEKDCQQVTDTTKWWL